MKCHNVPGLGTAGVPHCAPIALCLASCLAVKAVAEGGLLCTVSVGRQVRTEVQFKTFCVTPNPGVTSNPLRWCRGVCLRTVTGRRDLAQAALSLEMGKLLPCPPPAVVLVALERQVWGDMHPFVQWCVVLIGTRPQYFCSL